MALVHALNSRFLAPNRRIERHPFAFAPRILGNSPRRANKDRVACPRSSAEETKPKTVFVAGANGKTGKRIVSKLLADGFKVRAGVLDVAKARSNLPSSPNIEIIPADVTQGTNPLATSIGDADAVICATGFRYSLDVLAPWKVDYRGTLNLVEACRKNGIKRFVLISSILVNGAAWGQALNPAYLVLNAFGLTLIAKLQAENYVRSSGINYTIIRPGGLSEEKSDGNKKIVMAKQDTLSSGSISRDLVADVAVESIDCDDASFKVVEIVAEPGAQNQSIAELFALIS
ncbi:uncharacterized protein At2g34460, chloroplastic [Selaginella moellendorffii]|uniref:uncharacterized protein At2g34460, chloroplastic n=1 Tax=Selaginella moellendorffii TaxID=88036 RepID=UPI000D1C400D|nr:uncharacterized protein At2g34460, chloroplastic [Selaginella moellendorffii]|eukprot:XP_024525503.1 uncharacterized protein At2g34460, chloroplastic [Selaginella moellendorffii]